MRIQDISFHGFPELTSLVCLSSRVDQDSRFFRDVVIVQADLQVHLQFKINMYINLTASNSQMKIQFSTQHLHMQQGLS